MEIKSLSDSELVDLCKQESPTKTIAFNEIVFRYQNYILNYTLKKLKNREDAEDATQEVFIRIYFGIDNFRQDSELRTWIISIAKNVCFTMLLTKKNKFWKYNVLRDGTVDIENIYTTIVSDEDERYFWEKVGHVLRKMFFLYRKVFIFKYFKNMTLFKISQKLNLTISAAKMKIKRSKDQFISVFLKENE